MSLYNPEHPCRYPHHPLASPALVTWCSLSPVYCVSQMLEFERGVAHTVLDSHRSLVILPPPHTLRLCKLWRSGCDYLASSIFPSPPRTQQAPPYFSASTPVPLQFAVAPDPGSGASRHRPRLLSAHAHPTCATVRVRREATEKERAALLSLRFPCAQRRAFIFLLRSYLLLSVCWWWFPSARRTCVWAVEAFEAEASLSPTTTTTSTPTPPPLSFLWVCLETVPLFPLGSG